MCLWLMNGMTLVIVFMVTVCFLSRALLVDAVGPHGVPFGFVEDAWTLLMQMVLALFVSAMLFAIITGGFIEWVPVESAMLGFVMVLPGVIVGYAVAWLIITCMMLGKGRDGVHDESIGDGSGDEPVDDDDDMMIAPMGNHGGEE